MSSTHNTLTQQQIVQLALHMSSREEAAYIEHAKPSMPEYAKRAQKALGFTITRNNVLNAAKGAGIEWPTSTTAGDGRSLRPRVEALEASIRDITERLAGLDIRLGMIERDLGLNVPENGVRPVADLADEAVRMASRESA